jgi:beta-glucosidase
VSRTSAVSPEGIRYRDLNGNGRMDPFEDSRLSPEERVSDLVPRLSPAEKAGILFHMVMPVGKPGAHDAAGPFGPSTPRDLVTGRFINHFNVAQLPSAGETARWQNAMQELAEEAPHGIPVTFSTDPRHGFTQNVGMALAAGFLSQWPEPLGLAAIDDRDLVHRFADIARREYTAMGLRAALHPQIDLTTEPRWARQMQSLGPDHRRVSELVVQYLRGLQGDELGPGGVACTAKHFPGGGPQRDGEDPHFPYGREQVYPGGRFEEHLAPFRAAIAAGTSAVMPYYGMPVGLELDGTPVDEVGFGFNERIMVDLLRQELGYDGVVLTDWGLVTDVEVFGLPFPAKAWGVEHLPPAERLARLLDAGADQIGGEICTDLLLDLVEQGRVTMQRIDESVRRLLLVKFRLGLFDDPFVDEDAAERVVGAPEFREEGHRAQAEAVTVLKNEAVLPLSRDSRLYLEGVDPGSVAGIGTVVADPDDADVAIVRLQSPFEARNHYFLEAMTHQGSLDFPSDVIDRIAALARRVPVVLDVYLDRPAILTPLDPVVSALVVNFGASDAALLDALTGHIAPRGRLPVELPRSMEAVRNSRPDVPSDTRDPLYPVGSGRSIGER